MATSRSKSRGGSRRVSKADAVRALAYATGYLRVVQRWIDSQARPTELRSGNLEGGSGEEEVIVRFTKNCPPPIIVKKPKRKK